MTDIINRIKARTHAWRSEGSATPDVIDEVLEFVAAIEAAMREPVAETWQAVIDRIAPAMEILSDHDEEMYPAEAALALDRARIRRELAALKPDAAQDELVRITEQLAEREAEIERLRADAESCRKDAERMREAIKEAKTAMADYADATAYAILKAALEANPPRA